MGEGKLDAYYDSRTSAIDLRGWSMAPTHDDFFDDFVIRNKARRQERADCAQNLLRKTQVSRSNDVENDSRKMETLETAKYDSGRGACASEFC